MPWGSHWVAPCLVVSATAASAYSCTDGWGAYERHIAPEQHAVGTQHTQKIARKHSNLRTRITRRGRHAICFSTTTTRHDVVLGLCIHRYEFGRACSQEITTCDTPSTRCHRADMRSATRQAHVWCARQHRWHRRAASPSPTCGASRDAGHKPLFNDLAAVEELRHHLP
ncbi:MAG TPA: IS1 family transposase [Candidatus Tectomicrobia bacterium]